MFGELLPWGAQYILRGLVVLEGLSYRNLGWRIIDYRLLTICYCSGVAVLIISGSTVSPGSGCR